MTQEELIKKIDAEIAKLSDNACQMCMEDGGYRVACKDISDALHEIAKEFQPSLPSDLDTAAEKYSENILANNEDLQDAIEDAYKTGGMLVAGQFQKIEGELVDWYSTSEGKDYCCGVKTIDAFEVPEGFYIRKKQ